MTTLNSTFGELAILDRAALYIPHALYSLQLAPDVVSSVLLVASAVALITLGSYSTVCQPKTAQDPCDDTSSPLWDVTDRDDCPLYFTLAEQAAECNADLIGAKTALLLAAGAAGALYTLDYILRHYDISGIRAINFYFAAMIVPCGTITFLWMLGVALRSVGYALGLPRNLGYFFPRFRLSLSSEDRLPIGFVEPFDERKLGLNERTVHHYEWWMRKHNGVQVLRPIPAPQKRIVLMLVADSRFPLALAAALLLLVVFYCHNPQLSADYHLPRPNWLVNNAVATVFALCGCRQIRAPSFSVATLLLVALFAYDVYFVFATPMMEAVAVGAEFPIKLVFPHAPASVKTVADMFNMPYHQLAVARSILGLGDIVVPCVYTSLCLRLDYSLFYARNPQPFHRLRSIGVPVYFCTAVISYAVALATTVTVSQVYGRGQPALLYIVPALLLGVSLVGVIRGEWGEISAYCEHIATYDKALERAEQSAAEASDIPVRVSLQADAVYVFDDDETDDTYVIESDDGDDTDEDLEPLEDALLGAIDLLDEIDLLLFDQRRSG